MSGILHHRGAQLILAYSWERPAILVAGKGRGGMLLFLLTFIPVPLSSLPLSSSLLLSLLSLFYLFMGDDTKWHTRVDMSLNSSTINLKSERLPCSLASGVWATIWDPHTKRNTFSAGLHDGSPIVMIIGAMWQPCFRIEVGSSLKKMGRHSSTLFYLESTKLGTPLESFCT